MRVVFAGTPAFAAVSLRALLDAPDIELAGVMSQPDRPAGRGMRLSPSPVKRMALEHGLEVTTPARLRDNDEALEWLKARKPDVLVVVAFGMILPKAVLEAPRIAPVNVHASLLPRWRGAAPIERALLAGDAETGVCIMRMDEGLDTGPVYARRATPIAPDDTGASLRERLAEMGAALLIDTLPRIAAGLAPEPQPEEGASYAAKLAPEERNLDWSQPACAVDRVVRCFAPKPGARCRLRGRWLKVLRGRPLDRRVDAPAGTVVGVTDGLDIACGDGRAYRALVVQPEGKKAMDAGDFLRGARLEAGMRLD